MEEMSPAVAVPFRVGNSVCDNPTIATHMDITRLKLMTDTAALLSDSLPKETLVAGADEDCNCSSSDNEANTVAKDEEEDEEQGGVAAPLLDMISQDKTNWVAGDDDLTSRDIEEDDSISLEGDQILDSSCSLSAASESSSVCGEELLGFESAFEVGTSRSADTDKSACSVDVVTKATNSQGSNVESDGASETVAVAVSLEDVGDGSKSKPSAVVLQLPAEKGASGTVSRSVFELDYVPLWGFTSMCGRRPEMEDAFATVPRFSKIPVEMLIGDRVIDGMSKGLAHQTLHFFGVYDGHGGSQVQVITSRGFPLQSFYGK